jgi:mono/diheme cytochrome c family protein
VSLWSLPDWTNFLLAAIAGGQEGLLHLLAASGLTERSHGQPAWPFSQRLSGAVLLIDRSVVRQLLEALAFSIAGLCLLGLAICWRRGRVVVLLLAVVVFVFTPWPDRQLLLATAVPSSFHVSPSHFSADAIVHGQQVYGQHCASCHGLDGKGDTPLGLSLSPAPPNLASRLLWRRADGELFWKIAYGMHGRQGNATMPGFTGMLSDADIWALLDFMKANAAGASIDATGNWEEPVAFPAMRADCRDSGVQDVSQWHGQRLRVVLASGNIPQTLPLDDPRLHSLIVSAGQSAQPSGRRAAPPGQPTIDCVTQAATAWQALSIITAIKNEQLAGTQLLIDRDGWLRARKLPQAGNDAWSAADILCRPPALMPVTANTSSKDGLDQLIATMDETPVRYVKGGFVHGAQ